jgi:hypothetical protein
VRLATGGRGADAVDESAQRVRLREVGVRSRRRDYSPQGRERSQQLTPDLSCAAE